MSALPYLMPLSDFLNLYFIYWLNKFSFESLILLVAPGAVKKI